MSMKKIIRQADILNSQDLGEHGLVTIGMVSEKVDDYNTRINPRGMDNPPESVVVDFRHQGINIGCKLVATRNEVINGYDTLVGDFEVPKTSQLYIRSSDGRTIDDGNTYEAWKSGRLLGGSVEINPFPYPEHIKTDKNGRVYYDKYRISAFSFLDGQMSQDHAVALNKQNFRQSNNNMQFNVNDLAYLEDKAVIITKMDGEDVTYNAVTDNSEGTCKVADLREPTVEECQNYIHSTASGEAREPVEETKKEEAETERAAEEPAKDEPAAKSSDDTKEMMTKIMQALSAIEEKLTKTETEPAPKRASNPTLVPVDSLEPDKVEGVEIPSNPEPKISKEDLQRSIKEYKLNKTRI